MSGMQRFYFSLAISADQYLRHYRGAADRVIVRAQDGRSLSFPASSLRRFVSAAGVHGRFCMTVDDDHRLLSIERQPR